MTVFSDMPGILRERISKADASARDEAARPIAAVWPNSDDVSEAAKAAKAAKADGPPRPLLRKLPPATGYPVVALGNVLQPAAEAIEAITRAPIAIAAQSVLAAATLAVQAHANVILPIGQARPISAFFLTIAASGERKSACDDEALWPIRKREETLRAEHDAAIHDYENDHAAWDSARKKILNSKGDRTKKKAELDDLGPAPAPPNHPMLTVPEPTLEGLHKMLAIGQPSVGVFSAEGGQFVGHGMSDDAKLRTAAGFSCLWDGTPIQRVRAGDGASVLPGRRVCMHLMAQPEVCGAFLCDRVLTDQGLLSRVLVTAPESTMGSRFWRDPPPEARRNLKFYGTRLLSILESPLPLATEKSNELQPRRLSLAPDARALWIVFADHVEKQLAAGGAYEPIRGLANKLPEHAARLAGVLTLVDRLDAPHVSAEHMAQGIDLAKHYASEALRLHAAGASNPTLMRAEQALEWCRAQPGGVIALADLYQKGPHAIRDAATARNAVKILLDHGWLVEVTGGAQVKGQNRREVWRLREAGQ